ncbi:MAG: DUF4880 domain-containing protein [Pseudomonadota bacterium]
MLSSTRVDGVTRAAAGWLQRLESGHACPSERQVFKAWLAEKPEHLAAWQRAAAGVKAPAVDGQSCKRALHIGLVALLLGAGAMLAVHYANLAP